MKKNRIFVALLLIFISIAPVAQARSKGGHGQEKKPWLAGVLSIPLPGLGQYYVGGENVPKGIVMTAIDVGGVVMIFASYVNTINNIYNYGYNYNTITSTIDTGLLLGGCAVVVADTLWSVFDAMGDAKSYNAAHAAQSGMLMKQEPYTLTLAPVAFNSLGGRMATGPSLALRF